MANLIITIISIALVAVAALMGAYYGGTAFLQGQTKAYANTFVSQGEQLIAAWSIYSADHGGNWTITALGDLSNSPSYITSVPVTPVGVTASSGVTAWTPVNMSNTALSTGYNGVYVGLTNDTGGLSVCNLVAQMIGGSSATPTRATSATNVSNNTAKFGCTWFNASTSVIASGDTKYIYYRAY